MNNEKKLKGKKFIASYSGGKDSVLAIHRAIKNGMVPVGLVITYNSSMDKSWFHGIPQELLDEVATCLNLPIRKIMTTGEDYEEKFIEELKYQRLNGVDCCVFGDIDIDNHLKWCENVCKQADIGCCFPLWQENRKTLVEELIKAGYKTVITVVNTKLLSNQNLGKTLDLDVIANIEAEGADVCGENGEYHSFVYAGPLFKTKVTFSLGEKVTNGLYEMLPLLP